MRRSTFVSAAALLAALGMPSSAGQTFISGPGGIRIVNQDGVLLNVVDTEDSDQSVDSRYYRPPATWSSELDPVMGSGSGASANYRIGRCRMFLRGTEAMISMWTVVASSPKGIACSWNGEILVPNSHDWMVWGVSNPQSGLQSYEAQKRQVRADYSVTFDGKPPGPYTPQHGGRTLQAAGQPFDLGRVWTSMTDYRSALPDLQGRRRTDGYGSGAPRWETVFSGGDFAPSPAQQSALVNEYRAAGYDPNAMKLAIFGGYTGNWYYPQSQPQWLPVEDARLDGSGTPFCNLTLLQTNPMIASAPGKFGGIYCSAWTADKPPTPTEPDPPKPTEPDPPIYDPPVYQPPSGVQGGRPHMGGAGQSVDPRSGNPVSPDWAAWCRGSGRSESQAQACIARAAKR